MSDDIRDRVSDLLRSDFEHSMNGPNGFEESLRRAVLLLASELDSIKDNLDWHATADASHRSQAR